MAVVIRFIYWVIQRDGGFASFVVPYESDSRTGFLFALFAAHLQLGKGLVYQFDLYPGIFVDVVLVGKKLLPCIPSISSFLPGVPHFYQWGVLLSIAAWQRKYG